ncbi:response regulator, partial [Sulfurimonas sp.]|uniref:response regulator transcription factor n=1 Tax=Sulfurimonas sp. TaxID=2022749 RepID=UPI0025F4485C
MNKSYILKLQKLCYGLKVLYVEDDENISKQVHRILNRIFDHIDIEVDGKSGLEKYEEHNHDIVITDLSMPIINGIVMSHKIKQKNKDQMIIVTSAHNEMKYMSKLIDIGVNKFIYKPINLKNILEVLAKTSIKILKDKKKKIKHNVCAINNPTVIIDGNKIKHANESFKKYFLKDSDGDVCEFRLSCMFKDK